MVSSVIAFFKLCRFATLDLPVMKMMIYCEKEKQKTLSERILYEKIKIANNSSPLYLFSEAEKEYSSHNNLRIFLRKT